MADEKVLDYHDILLRGADVELLRGPDWLNDQIISFFFEYLQEDKHKGEDVPGIVAPLGLAARRLVLLAVNNNPYADEAGGGSHWSLLAFHRSLEGFVHYDSMANANESMARQVAAALWPLMGVHGEKINFRAGRTPQQHNGVDCGVHVAASADVLCAAYSTGEEAEAALGERVAAAVHTWREETLELITRLSKSGPG
mmetsp:Transcript_18079/g.58490  ORF Transcript_18079/g.58490 Transcript_18079/m.58490 type:complete len:198 (-) Transcript_18079:51-644(-)